MTPYELADALQETEPYYSTDYKLFDKAAFMLRNQQTQIDRLNYEIDGFKQNFFVSGFQLQIKMANEQLVKQQDEIDALKKELYFKAYYEELPKTPVDLLRKAQEK